MRCPAQYIIDPAADGMGLPFYSDLSRAVGDQHDLFLGMLMRGMRHHAGFQGQPANGQRAELPGGTVEVDALLAVALVGEFRVGRIEDETRQMTLLCRGEAGEERQRGGGTQKCASVRHGRMLQAVAGAVSANATDGRENISFRRRRMSAATVPAVESNATHAARLDRLAAVAIEVGLGLARGQELLITASLDALPLVRRITEHAYRAGASLVTTFYSDDEATLARFRYAPRCELRHRRHLAAGRHRAGLPQQRGPHGDCGRAIRRCWRRKIRRRWDARIAPSRRRAGRRWS